MKPKTILKFSALSTLILFCSFPVIAQESSLSMFFDDEMLVETASRHPKPLTEVAENLTVVNAAAIESMNAHTLYEVLARVPGLFVTYDGMDFGSDASLTIHGASSEDLHRILVLLDGVRLNLSSNGNAILNGIPVSIIERLEIIKGPASSSWGSAMGGVINIITKEAWNGYEGQMYGSYGTADSREVRMELSGKGTDAGCYLFAGNQHSDGLEEDRFFDNTQVYVKGNATLKPGIQLMLSGGIFRPEWKNLNFLPADLMIAAENRNGFFTSALDRSVGSLLSFHLSGGIIARNFTKKYDVLSGLIGTPGETLSKQSWREKSYNLNSRLVYSDGIQAFVLGAEYVYNRLESSVDSTATAVAAWGTLPTSELPPDTNRTVGIYMNDTLSWDRFTLTPGIRYDYNSISDDFISPSLGLVYRVTENNRLRITAARGFSTPYFSLLRDLSRNQSAANPDLKPEEIWSVQAGLETRSIPYLLCKTTFFYHDIDEIWKYSPDTGHIENGDNTRRSGFEIEAESVPYHGLSVAGGFTYTVDDPDSGSSEDFYNTQIKVNYTNPELFSLHLFGTAIKWLKGTTFEEKEDFIWDLNINRHFSTVSFRSGFDLFVTVHNLFNGDQYWSSFYPNPERWIEAGLKFRF